LRGRPPTFGTAPPTVFSPPPLFEAVFFRTSLAFPHLFFLLLETFFSSGLRATCVFFFDDLFFLRPARSFFLTPTFPSFFSLGSLQSRNSVSFLLAFQVGAYQVSLCVCTLLRLRPPATQLPTADPPCLSHFFWYPRRRLVSFSRPISLSSEHLFSGPGVSFFFLGPPSLVYGRAPLALKIFLYLAWFFLGPRPYAFPFKCDHPPFPPPPIFFSKHPSIFLPFFDDRVPPPFLCSLFFVSLLSIFSSTLFDGSRFFSI